MKPIKILFLACLINILLLAGSSSVHPVSAATYDCTSYNQTAISESECDALEALYNATNGPNWHNSTHKWLVGTDPCDWYGVECISGHVDQLLLNGNDLAGDLPAEITDLVYLTTLSLQENALTGSIPVDIDQLSAMVYMSLGNNQFSGEIPAAFGNISTLVGLGLGDNQLSGEIPPELGQLTNLWAIWLQNNQLTGALPPELGDLASLDRLYLSNNQLSGELPPELGQLDALVTLHIGDNEFTGSIPPEMGAMSSLQYFSLSSNQLTGSIPPELGNLSALTDLTAFGNELSGPVPAELGQLTNLTVLNFGDNNLSGVIPAQLGNLVLLERMDLSRNQFTGIVPETFSNLVNIYEFHAYDNLVCEPSSAAYLAWKEGVTDYQGTGTCVKDMFYSLAANDGWVLESGENTNKGGTLNTTNLICNVGDDAQKRQYRTILHFNTSRLPDTAVVTQSTLQYKQHSLMGSDPYLTHGSLVTDIKQGYFSNNVGLVLSDFGAAASMNNAGVFKFVPSSLAYSLYRTILKSTALQYINLIGTTQFRLRFTLDDDNDLTADYVKMFCGDMPEPFNRPVLRVWYYVP